MNGMSITKVQNQARLGKMIHTNQDGDQHIFMEPLLIVLRGIWKCKDLQGMVRFLQS